MSIQMISIKHALSNSIFNLSWISLMVFGRIWSCLWVVRFHVMKSPEKDKLNDFHALKFKTIKFCYVWFSWYGRTGIYLCFSNDQIYRITNVLPFIRLSVINSYAREFGMYTNAWNISLAAKHLYHTFYLPPKRILSICLSIPDDWY